MKRTAIFIAVLMFLASSAFGVSITGRVRIVGRAPGNTLPTIVYAEALDGPAHVQPGKFSMAQRNKTFQPRVLAVPVGSTIQFPNEDLIFHNVFSLSRPAPFDLGLYRAGTSQSRTFTAPAIYNVFCNIHPQMAAVILVLPTSYIAEADASGNYRLELPAGRYRITAWSERAQPITMETIVSASMAPIAELVLDESKFVESQHKDKYGQNYPKSAYDQKK